MSWQYSFELTLSELYKHISEIILILVILSFLSLLFIKLNFHLKFLKSTTNFLEKNKRLCLIFFSFILIILILFFLLTKITIHNLDKSTTVKIDEKIIIIEIDDYWNIHETQEYFERYGYTLERYRSVSDILNKNGFVATLGVTPYIFVEELRQNFPLRNDPEMIDYLKELDSLGYELAMHGFNHCRNIYYCPKYEEVWFNIIEGKIELESIFGKKIITYFPPGNDWTTEQYKNVKEAGFLIIGNTHVPKAYFDEDVIITPRGHDPIYVYQWYALDFRHSHYLEWIEEYNKKNLFILQLHANTFDNYEKLEELDKFLEYVKKDGARIMTYSGFYSYVKEKRELKDKGPTGYIITELKRK